MNSSKLDCANSRPSRADRQSHAYRLYAFFCCFFFFFFLGGGLSGLACENRFRFGRIYGPFSSCRGPRAALNCSYRDDGVTRLGLCD